MAETRDGQRQAHQAPQQTSSYKPTEASRPKSDAYLLEEGKGFSCVTCAQRMALRNVGVLQSWECPR